MKWSIARLIARLFRRFWSPSRDGVSPPFGCDPRTKVRIGLSHLESREAAGSLLDAFLGTLFADPTLPTTQAAPFKIPSEASFVSIRVSSGGTETSESVNSGDLLKTIAIANNLERSGTDFLQNQSFSFDGLQGDLESLIRPAWLPVSAFGGAPDLSNWRGVWIDGVEDGSAVSFAPHAVSGRGQQPSLPLAMSAATVLASPITPSGFGGGGFSADDPVEPSGGGSEIVKATVREVTYHGNELITIVADPGTPTYPGPPHWLDTNLNGVIDQPDERSLPVGYPRNTIMEVSAKFEPGFDVPPAPTPGYPDFQVRGEVFISQLPEYKISIPWTPVELVGGDLVLTQTKADNPFKNYVDYFEEFRIVWQLKTTNIEPFVPIQAGASKNEMYVTLATPGISPVFHTLIHLSVPISAQVRAADEATVIAQTWQNFETNQVQTKHIFALFSGHPLKYYGELDTPIQTVIGLLTKKDGQCASFVEAFESAIKTNIGAAPATPMLKFHVASPINGMLINTWEFDKAGGSTGNYKLNNVTYPFQNTLAAPAENPNNYPHGVGSFTRKNANSVWEYYWGATVDVVEKAGVPGQNTANPKSHFTDHALIRISGKYYDPSYGNRFDSLQAWEDASVPGFYTIGTLPGNNYRLIFRTNPAGPDIITQLPGA